ncbi:hypothetical protein J5X84_36230 [Streptosporangiaceae bacterium NEAU-GS5]|nr:hypothetical protein [Streptosporangiaceae bacterium NEAU-GS5]
MSDDTTPALVELVDRREHLRITTDEDDPDAAIYGFLHSVPPHLIEALNQAWGQVYAAQNEILRHMLETGQPAPNGMSNYEFRKRATE